MNYEKPFQKSVEDEFKKFVDIQANRFSPEDTLAIDLHCHDYNSDETDELIGRLLNVPETWLKTQELMDILKRNGSDTYTITNHDNARSCFDLMEKGVDILPGAEFSCHIPEYKTSIHVLTFGFTRDQEKKLNKLRGDLYLFQRYAMENDIPTIWAHPLYCYSLKGELPLSFFNKTALMFERFEVINGQRDTWHNMLTKIWIESLTEERIREISSETGIAPGDFCRSPFHKAMSGGSDCHMGIYAGLTGTKLHVPQLAGKLKTMSRAGLALEAIRRCDMAPYGTLNETEKLTTALLDYFCQIAMYMKDPGILRLLLHKGTPREKFQGLVLANAFSEIKQHSVTMKFLETFHQSLMGNAPGFAKKLFIKKDYKKIFDQVQGMAVVMRDNPIDAVPKLKESVEYIYKELYTLFFNRLKVKLDLFIQERLKSPGDLKGLIENLELPSSVRSYTGNSRKSSVKGSKGIEMVKFLDGLSFPFLASSIIAGASFASARVLYNSRNLLTEFSEKLGVLRHPKRMLWLTDTFEDNNGVSIVLKSVLNEIRIRNLPIDLLVCSSTLKSGDHLVVVPPIFEFTFPFYEQQPLRIPNLLEVHNIFREREYDRLICSTEGPMGLVSIFLKKAYQVPAYFYIHTDWIMFAKKVLELDRHNQSRMRRILRAFYGSFDGLFVLNTDQHKWLTGREMGFSKSVVHQTAHWVDDGFEEKKSSRLELFNIRENEHVLLFAGRVSNEKGVMEIPQIYQRVREVYPDIKLVVAGAGPAEGELKKAIPDAVYLGWVDHDKLPGIYSAADLLILPSRFDTFGCVVLEAMSCGLPVIAYKTKGPKDIIIHDKNGFLVKTKSEMADMIIHFFSSEKMRKVFKKRALERANQYRPDTIIRKLMKDINLPYGEGNHIDKK